MLHLRPPKINSGATHDVYEKSACLFPPPSRPHFARRARVRRSRPSRGGWLAFFSGTNQYVEVPNFQNVGVSNEVTVEFWANTATTRAQAAFVLNPDNPANRFLAGLN